MMLEQVTITTPHRKQLIIIITTIPPRITTMVRETRSTTTTIRANTTTTIRLSTTTLVRKTSSIITTIRQNTITSTAGCLASHKTTALRKMCRLMNKPASSFSGYHATTRRTPSSEETTPLQEARRLTKETAPDQSALSSSLVSFSSVLSCWRSRRCCAPNLLSLFSPRPKKTSHLPNN